MGQSPFKLKTKTKPACPITLTLRPFHSFQIQWSLCILHNFSNLSRRWIRALNHDLNMHWKHNLLRTEVFGHQGSREEMIMLKEQFRVLIEQLTVQMSWSQHWSRKRFVAYGSSRPPRNKCCFSPAVIPYIPQTNHSAGKCDMNKG